MHREGDPLPNFQALRCLQADDAFKDFIDNRDLPKQTDDQYERMQSAVECNGHSNTQSMTRN